MIVKKNFSPAKVVTYVKAEMAVAILSSVAAWAVCTTGVAGVAIPFPVCAILGSALAIFIAFRNNSAYSRWWEARTLWGNIINSSRVLARLVITFTDSHAHQQNYDRNRSELFKKEMIYHIIAWAHALRLHLRTQNNWNELQRWLSPVEYKLLQAAENKPNYMQMLTGRKIYEAMANGTLGGFDSFQMEGQLLTLSQNMASCERIKHTPMLRQYDYFTRVFLYTFMVVLPFSLCADFVKMHIEHLLVPVSVVVSFVFAIIGKVGAVNEDPFENRITDVPLSALCNTIERDLCELLGETERPLKLTPENGYLY
jgi:putative membrane protein